MEMTLTQEVRDTCLYMHTRKSDGRIFYIGIGDEKRPTDKAGRNQYWYNTVNLHDYDVTILVDGLTWSEACELEVKMIAFYGRRDLGLGCLVNMTDGGEGAKGRVLSQESIEKVRQKNIEIWADPVRRQKMSEERRKPEDTFIGELKVIYGDRYDYSQVNYINQNHKVTLGCKTHGRFDQWPGHLLNGVECQKCSMEDQTELMRKPVDTFIMDAKRVHGDKYDYSKVVYKGSKYKVEIVCSEHGSFFQTADNHINNGHGCKECGKKRNSEAQKKIKPEDRHNAKIVMDLNTGVFYLCAKEAAEVYGVNSSTMTSWLNGKRTNKTSLKYV